MKSFLFGSVFGIAVGTVGFSGVAPMLDELVVTIQNTSRNWAKSSSGGLSSAPAAPYLPEQSQSNWDELIRQELAKQQSQSDQ